METLKGKRYVRVPFCEQDCPLSLNEKLVYGYLLYQVNRYHDWPTQVKIGKNTGLKRQTVAGILHRLEELGIVQGEGLGPVPAWVRCKQGDPVRWHCHIRTPGQSELLVTDAALWSYICHMHRTNFCPKPLTMTYFGECLGVNRETIRESLKRLESLGLVFWESRGDLLRVRARVPNERALALFSDVANFDQKEDWSGLMGEGEAPAHSDTEDSAKLSGRKSDNTIAEPVTIETEMAGQIRFSSDRVQEYLGVEFMNCKAWHLSADCRERWTKEAMSFVKTGKGSLDDYIRAKKNQ